MLFSRFALIGPPASGKGTQCHQISLRQNLLHLSTGHLIRREIDEQTEVGLLAQKHLEQGDLLADSVVLDLVYQELAERDFDQYLLDGFPRTLPQAEAFEQLTLEKGKPLQAVFLLDVPEALLLERVLNRATCPECGHTMATAGSSEKLVCPSCSAFMERRVDDSREVFAKRMEAYKEQVDPLVSFYQDRGILVRIEAGASSVEEVTARLLAEISDKAL